MGDFSLVGKTPFALESGFELTGVKGTTITADASANTKGAWVELLSAAGNTYGSDTIYVVISNLGTGNNNFLLDIGIGAAASEVVIAPNLYAHTTGVTASPGSLNTYYFPIKINKGERISARVQSDTGGESSEVLIIRAPASFSSGQGTGRVVDIGTSLGGSTGTTVARTTANTFGAWVEIDAAIVDAFRGLSVTGIQSVTTSWTSNNRVTYEVGVGSAGNEETIFNGWLISQGTDETTHGATMPFIPVGIPAGSRVSIRAAASTGNSDLDLEYIIYGVV